MISNASQQTAKHVVGRDGRQGKAHGLKEAQETRGNQEGEWASEG